MTPIEWGTLMFGVLLLLLARRVPAGLAGFTGKLAWIAPLAGVVPRHLLVHANWITDEINALAARITKIVNSAEL